MNTKTFRTFALIGAVGAFAAACSEAPTQLQPGDEFLRPSLDIYTMTDSAQFDTINGAQWSTAYVPTGSVGTGVIRPFLDMASQDCKAGVPAAGADNENGFNTDNDAFVYCQHRTTDTNKLPLNYIPVLVEGGTAWREFVLDAHESDGSFGITEFEVYICGSAAAITYQTRAEVLAGCTEIYDIGPHTIVATDQYSSGSGNVFDYRILVPNAAFVAGLAGASCPYNPTPAGETACGKYVIVWSKMTGTGSTFEEYSTILRPAPGTLQLKKIVVNDNGGTAGVNDFGIVTSAPEALVWDAGVTVGSTTTYSSQVYQLSPGSYTFSEINVAGYSEGTWSCTGATATGTAYNAGSVTVADELTIVCQITNNDIAPALTLDKITSYSNGGTRPESDWTLIANKDGGAAELSGPGAPGSGDVISGSTFQAGTYALSETGTFAGYQNGTTFSCVKNGAGAVSTNSIVLGVGDVATCSITNTDIAGSLQLKKIVVNDNGGTADVDDFGIVTNAGALTWDGGVTVGSTTTYTSNVLAATGAKTFSEIDFDDYTEGTWSCTGATASGTAYNAGGVTVPLATAVVCQITNNDVAPSLTLNKITSYSFGGTRPESDWTLIANKDGGAAELTGPGAPGSADVVSGATFQAGTYALSETGGPYTGYANGTTYSCVKNGAGAVNGNSITMAVGDVAVCSITNTDTQGSLQLKKIVVNDNGGTADVDDFGIVTNAGALTWDAGSTVGSTTTYTSNVIAASGAKTFSEIDFDDYTEGTWSCTGATASGTAYNAGGVTVPLGTAVVCQITNNDVAPSLTLNKITSYTNGGTRPESDWTLIANKDGGAAELTGPGAPGGADVVSGATFQAGTYALSETGGPYTGYQNGTTYSCVKNGAGAVSTNSITMAVGDVAVCSITNIDVAGSLQLKKIVVNDNGGTADVDDFGIVTNAGALTWDAGSTVGSTTTYTSNVIAATGAKTFSEIDFDDYTEGTWSCTGATASGTAYNAGGVTIPLGTAVVCQITNNDVAPSLTLNKITSYSYGGTRPESDWTLLANTGGGAAELTGPGAPGGADVVSGATFQAGTYALSETGGPYTGYQNGTTYSCVKNGAGAVSTNSIVLAVGDVAVCSITNTDLPGSIRIVKNVVGTGRAFTFNTTGTGLTNPFDLTPPDDGQDSLTFNGLSAGAYSVTEVVPSGYLLTGLDCSAGGTADYTVNSTASIVLPLGGFVRCVYENTEQSSDITRTQGFWQTHLELTEAVWFGGTVGEHTFPGIDPTGFCVGKDFPTIAEVMGGFWSNIAKTTTNQKRSDLDQARMRLAQQLMAAILNNAAFNSSPSGGISIGDAKAAFCGTDIAAINAAMSAMAAFNESGDSELFTPGVSANAKEAREIANLVYWNILP